MNNSLSEFVYEMNSLKKYINFQQDSYKLAKSGISLVSTDLSIAKIKLFSFNSYVISLYGEFENFIEQIKLEYLSKICSIIKNFSELPKQIQEHNLLKTVDIIKNLNHRKFKHIKVAKVVEDLHSNINSDQPCLNLDAFKNHTANFRIATINTYFSEVGIHNLEKKIMEYNPLKKIFEDSYPQYQSMPCSILFSKIDHICDIRNDIAHGVKIVEILEKNVLFEHIDFFIIFAKTLYELLNDYYLSILFKYNNVELEVINIFKHNILCCNTKNNIIDKKCKILAKKNSKQSPKYFLVDILKIEHNRISLDSTENFSNIDIGMQVNGKINNKMQFKLIKSI